MITRRSLLVVLVCASCLATLFFAIPVSSVGTYDPWLDYNDDGKIDLKDVYPMHKAYGALGDPTKNVNVTNLVPSMLDYEVLYLGRVNITVESVAFVRNCSGGYSRIGFFATPVKAKNTGTYYKFNLTMAGWIWELQPWSSAFEQPDWDLRGQVFSDGGINHYSPPPFTLVNQAPGFLIGLRLTTDYPQPDDVWIVFDFCAYLRNE